jgi:hypothetical protein
MSLAQLAGMPFYLDPESVRGGFRVKTAVFDTQGGRVLQVLGTVWEDIFVTGSFGRGGFEDQRDFLASRTPPPGRRPGNDLARSSGRENGTSLSAPRRYPLPDGGMSVRVDQRIINPR